MSCASTRAGALADLLHMLVWQYMRDAVNCANGLVGDAIEGAAEVVQRRLQGVEVQTACGLPSCGFAIQQCEFVRIGDALLPPVSGPTGSRAEGQLTADRPVALARRSRSSEVEAQREQGQDEDDGEGDQGDVSSLNSEEGEEEEEESRGFRLPWGALSQFQHFQEVTLRDYVLSQYGWEAENLSPGLCPNLGAAAARSSSKHTAAAPPPGTLLAHGVDIWLHPSLASRAQQPAMDTPVMQPTRQEIATVILPPSHVAVDNVVAQRVMGGLLKELNWCRLRLLFVGQRKEEQCWLRLLDNDAVQAIATLVLTE